MRTGSNYLAALRDGRQVYLGSKLVSNVTTDPAFSNTAKSFARVYDLKGSADHIDDMSFSEDGQRYSAWFLMPKSKEDLFKRAHAHQSVAQWTHGLMGRSPDHVASYLVGMCMQPELFEGKNGVWLSHLKNYLDYIKKRDLFVCYLVLSPHSSRPPARPEKEYPSLRVVAEDSEGITVHGVKTLGTAAVFSDEALVGCMMPLGAGQENEAVTFAVPIATAGIKVFVRKSYEAQAQNKVDSYFSSQFDESDAVMTFDHVRIPWERVFTYKNLEVTRDMYYKTPAHIMGNHQANWRFLTKFKLINGIAYESAKLGGLLSLPPIQQTLGTLAAAEAAIEGLISSQIHNFETLPSGYVHINRRYMYATLSWCANNYYQIAEDVRTLLGSGPFLLPADASILNDGETGSMFDLCWDSPGADARLRYKFVRLAWDFLGSEFASRQTQYERFYGGPPHVMSLYNFLQCPWQEREASINTILESMESVESTEKEEMHHE